MGTNTGETLQERSKGKDVRTSNIVAAKVRLGFGERYLWYLAASRLEARLEAGRILLAFSNFGQKGAWRSDDGAGWRLVPETFRPAAIVIGYCFPLIY